MSTFERYLTLWVAACIVAGIALATVVGVLIEVPVMLSVVWIVNASQAWYDRGNVSAEARTVRPHPVEERGAQVP
jgi:ACR3 family arsenite efflux pump ArsB